MDLLDGPNHRGLRSGSPLVNDHAVPMFQQPRPQRRDFQVHTLGHFLVLKARVRRKTHVALSQSLSYSSRPDLEVQWQPLSSHPLLRFGPLRR